MANPWVLSIFFNWDTWSAVTQPLFHPQEGSLCTVLSG